MVINHIVYEITVIENIKCAVCDGKIDIQK
jgi:hypothetical protein